VEAEPDLHARDTTMAVVSRAPIAQIERFKASKGWTFPWYSSYGGDFNYDFQVTLDESVAPVEYNSRPLRSGRPRGSRSSHASCTARAPFCATANASFTPTRRTRAAPSRSAARTTTST
jgi:predicted dithiol-disulfide oxidoreductase (DUF899 family)